MYYFDWTYSLILIGVVISLLASGRVRSTYAKYSRVRNHAGITGGYGSRADSAPGRHL